jgi:hypothetical protein
VKAVGGPTYLAASHTTEGDTMKITMKSTIAASAGILALCGAGAAGATITGTPVSNGVISACWTTAPQHGSTLHRVVLINSGNQCPATMTKLTWNQKGQTGVTGPTGPAGPAGPAGAAGPQGPAGMITVGPGGLDVIEITASGFGTARADCPPDHPWVVGGGGAATGGGALSDSTPEPTLSNPTGWAVGVYYAPGAGQSSAVSAFALCAK